MAITYKKIASVTVGAGGAANIEFTSIGSTYTDLIVKFSLREETAENWTALMQINGSTASIYSSRYLQGNGAAASSGNQSSTYVELGVINSSTSTASTFGNGEIYLPNYTGSTNKSFSGDTVSETNATTAYARMVAGLWSSTASITSLKIYLASGDIAQYSTATLYGILKA